MTAEPNKPENNDIDIDELTSKWFDSGPDEYQIDEYSEIICEKMDSEKLRQTADLQLVNSMLIQLADKDQVAKERQIQNVLNNVKNSCTASSQFGNATHSKFYCYTRPLIRYAVAAVLIVSITFIVTQMSTNTAMAAIDKMMAAINNAVDRTYSIMVEGNRENRQQQSRRNSQGRREQGQRADLDGATLYLRGTNQFVLYRQTSRDRTLINGGDGQTRWMIRPDKTVFTSSDPEAFKIPMPKELAAILTLDFKATLQHIRDHYKVKFIEDIYDDQTANSTLKYLDAQKKSRDFPGPQNIEILADTKTGLLLQIEFAGIHLQGDPLPKRLIIKLQDQKPLPPDWFTRQAHHPEDFQVDFISE